MRVTAVNGFTSQNFEYAIVRPRIPSAIAVYDSLDHCSVCSTGSRPWLYAIAVYDG